MVDEVELAAELEPQRTEHARHHPGSSAAKSSVVPGRPEGLELPLGERVRDRRAHLALVVEDEIGEALRPHAFAKSSRRASSLREKACGARRKRTAGAFANTPNPDPRVTSVASWISRPKRRSGLSDPKRSIASCVRHPRERNVESSTPMHSRQMRATVRSTSPKRNSRVGERHLHVELRQLLQPVGAEVLVPEAARDLVVALEARDREQLLVDLRRLRQGEEAAALKAGRDEEVARALRRRLRHDRRLDVDEARPPSPGG